MAMALWVLVPLAMAYSLSGRKGEASKIIEKCCKISSTPFTVEVLDFYIKMLPFKA
jgi:hypothetical protein